MVDADLTDDQIAVLCDIGESGLTHETEDKKRLVEGLISTGYVELTQSRTGSGFKLTAKATTMLTERGVGLNES